MVGSRWLESSGCRCIVVIGPTEGVCLLPIAHCVSLVYYLGCVVRLVYLVDMIDIVGELADRLMGLVKMYADV